MRVYMNFTAVRGPYGGANSFLRALRDALEDHGLKVVTSSADRADVALLNALTNDLDRDTVERIAERIPVVHRKTGYRGRGSDELRAEVDGAIRGDRLQIEFGPFVSHTIFQSAYSRDVFTASGFAGDFTVISNGVDERVFNSAPRKGLFRREVRRSAWDGREPLRVAISTWSTDPSKGFPEYARIDGELGEVPGVDVRLIGRVPSDLTFSSIAVTPPRSRSGLARFLKEQHVLLHLTQWESCSNALLEGINCGLPVIYLDSGSNREFAERYGVEYRGSFKQAVDEMKARYAELRQGTLVGPYGISRIAPEYVRVLEAVA